MNCDDLFRFIETGNPLQKTVARLHLRRCRQCLFEWQRLCELKRELGHSAPLTKNQQRRWLANADSDSMQELHEGRRRWSQVGIAFAAITIAFLGLWFSRNPPANKRQPDLVAAPMSSAPISTEVAWGQLADVRSGLADLSAELSDLSELVDLLDEENEVNALLAEYDAFAQ